MTYESKISAGDDTTEWFNCRDIDSISPFSYVEQVATEFYRFLDKRGYTLDTTQNQFLYDLCTATCTMYYYQVWHKNKFIVGAPKRKFTYPKQWTGVLEGKWNDYIHSRIVNYEFWDNFWRKLPPSYWEGELRDNWRDVMQFLLPFYIRRELDILLEEEIVCQEDDGNIITWDDHELEEESDICNADSKKKK
jgi:hypothetical protein